MKSFALLASSASAIIHTAYVPSQGVYMTVDRPMEDSMMQFRPEDLKHAHKAWEIFDADGDGVEDNVEKTREELDRFEIPAVFGPAEEMHNTHHGNLPGHVRAEEEETEPTYFDPYSPSDFEGFADLTIHV